MSQDDLEDRIASMRAQDVHQGSTDADRAADPGLGRAMSFGLGMGAQFFGAVVGGGFLGWVIDRWLGTSPLGMVSLMVLFFGAALVNVWFMMSRAAAVATEAAHAGAAPAVDADEVTDETDGKSS